ncbi:GNAT family N-acetyltransferase [Parasphingorhabdus halotolerans]|uniref:GNAT family N-acetyltransferase n=1 Tax=Parasphingorhabdus halotolerans TaxID=2725558 RepID=A0A6H2DKI0_9SPHN|nr:GNAT family N-acetyltransferase [Parasphingorhabdus halotolerans]QJB68647.1 GNAT family N-acetyltransferase [Parasphingorhabdus halotolerans]
MTMNSFRKKAESISASEMLTGSDVALMDTVRTVGSESVEQLGEITADAFRHDPFNNWFFHDFDAMQQVFTLMAKHIYAPNGFCQIWEENGQACAATMWTMPGDKADLSLLATLEFYWSIFSRGGLAALKRGKATTEAMEAHHPKEPHAYLFTVGVVGEARGRGLGRQLIEPVLQACDQTGTMAYLENSNPANTRVYNSLGFERVTIFHPMPGCPPLEAMTRKPQ